MVRGNIEFLYWSANGNIEIWLALEELKIANLLPLIKKMLIGQTIKKENFNVYKLLILYIDDFKFVVLVWLDSVIIHI
jgi:hypothetical protein